MTNQQERRLFGENTTYNARRSDDVKIMVAESPSNKVIVFTSLITLAVFTLHSISTIS